MLKQYCVFDARNEVITVIMSCIILQPFLLLNATYTKYCINYLIFICSKCFYCDDVLFAN